MLLAPVPDQKQNKHRNNEQTNKRTIEQTTERKEERDNTDRHTDRETQSVSKSLTQSQYEGAKAQLVRRQSTPSKYRDVKYLVSIETFNIQSAKRRSTFNQYEGTEHCLCRAVPIQSMWRRSTPSRYRDVQHSVSIEMFHIQSV